MSAAPKKFKAGVAESATSSVATGKVVRRDSTGKVVVGGRPKTAAAPPSHTATKVLLPPWDKAVSGPFEKLRSVPLRSCHVVTKFRSMCTIVTAHLGP